MKNDPSKIIKEILSHNFDQAFVETLMFATCTYSKWLSNMINYDKLTLPKDIDPKELYEAAAIYEMDIYKNLIKLIKI